MTQNVSAEVGRFVIPWVVLVKDIAHDVARRILIALVKYVAHGDPGLLQDLVPRNSSEESQVV